MRHITLLCFVTLCLLWSACKKEDINSAHIERYLGSFSGKEESCSVSQPGSYIVEILKEEYPQVSINNLWGTGSICYATVGDDGNLYIATQPYYNGTITGRAMIINGKLRIGFTISDTTVQNITDNCIWEQY